MVGFCFQLTNDFLKYIIIKRIHAERFCFLHFNFKFYERGFQR